MQEDHDFADGPLLGPTRGDAIGALRTNAGNFPQPMRLRFDDGPAAYSCCLHRPEGR
jgi:hypothetical protein